MTIRIKCSTCFDITATGIKNRFNRSKLPLVDATGNTIASDSDWQKARNQQSNWETINQIISLRTLPEHITTPKQVDGQWYFEFTVNDPNTISRNGNPVAALNEDCSSVPMALGLNEIGNLESVLIPGQNVWFELIEV